SEFYALSLHDALPISGTCEGELGLLRLAQVDRVDRVLGRGGAFLDAGEAGVVEHAGGELPSPHGAETGSSLGQGHAHAVHHADADRKSTRLNSSHRTI